MFRLERFPRAIVALALSCSAIACSRSGEQELAATTTEDPPPTNRVAIPKIVRDNLGITFATAQRRVVSRTLRVPGRFELPPAAVREVRSMIDGRVELLVTQYQEIAVGTPLFRLESPRWRELQQEIAEAEAALLEVRAKSSSIGPLRDAHRVHEQALADAQALWQERVRALENAQSVGGGRADELATARAALATTRSDHGEVLEKDAELEARAREIEAREHAAASRFDLLLASASTLASMPRQALLDDDSGVPRWRQLDVVEVAATTRGVVSSIACSNGAWLEGTALVMTIVDPALLRFHAHGLQNDLWRLRDGLPAQVVAPLGSSLADHDAMRGPLKLGLAADPDQRTIDLYCEPESLAPWARPGVTAFLEVVLDGGEAELSIPLAALARDGLERVFFRRDPKDEDLAIRMVADLGIDDGRHVVVKSGLREGDEVVLDGVHQLMLATSGNAAKGGHFHADGTFHRGDD
jgi:hypothetical protein